MDQWIREYKIPFLLAVVSVGIIIICVVLIIKSTQTTTPIVFSEEASVAGVLSGSIQIDIEGAVENPGVYTLAVGSRVEDAIVAAGGMSGEADAEVFAKTINRAAKVVDGGKLYIPKIGEKSTTLETSYNDSLVNINSASESQLEALPGVGPVTAQKIIAGRPYQTLDELVAKKALGQSLFEKVKSQLAL